MPGEAAAGTGWRRPGFHQIGSAEEDLLQRELRR
jgi:hypothetical protein